MILRTPPVHHNSNHADAEELPRDELGDGNGHQELAHLALFTVYMTLPLCSRTQREQVLNIDI
jgi:hypothetical protein